MTEMRDARFDKALAHAPDAHMAPDAKTRAAILAMASQRLAPSVPAPAVPWWKRLTGGGAGSGRMPWNAALATVLLASLVTVIWRHEEIPGAKTSDQQIPTSPPSPASPRAEREAEAPSSSSPAPAAKPMPPQRPPAREPTPPPEAMAVERRDASRERSDAMASKAQSQRAATMNKSAPVMPEQAEKTEQAKKGGGAADSTSPEPADAPPQPAAPAPGVTQVAPAFAPLPRMADRAARLQESARSPAAASTGALSGPAASGALSGAAAPSLAQPVLDVAALDEWTQVRISVDGRSTLIARAQAGGLPAQVRALAFAATRPGGDAAVSAEAVSLELLRDGVPVGRLLVGESGARWQQLRAGFARNFAGVVDVDTARELMAEARRLLNR